MRASIFSGCGADVAATPRLAVTVIAWQLCDTRTLRYRRLDALRKLHGFLGVAVWRDNQELLAADTA